VNVRGVSAVVAECRGGVAYHDSCSSLREMSVKDEPRRLLSSVSGLKLCEIKEPQVCCGFGGFFSVKYPDVSARMADDKIADAIGTGADTLVGGDLGCLLHLSGRLARRGKTLAVRHAAEVMAGLASEPAIGEDSA
jgi:L-lactate dehydrogenase complex protein LldE